MVVVAAVVVPVTPTCVAVDVTATHVKVPVDAIAAITSTSPNKSSIQIMAHLYYLRT